jgi:hypothetical protein
LPCANAVVAAKAVTAATRAIQARMVRDLMCPSQ